MWYRKAIDLNELKKMFPEEAEEVSGEFEASDLIEKLSKGEEWTSPSGAISVRENPKFEPFTKEEIISDFDFYDTGVDFYESIRDYPINIDLMVKTLNTISKYVDSKVKQNAKSELLDCQKEWFELIDKYEERVIEEAKPSYKGEYLRVKPEDKQKAIEIITKQTKTVSDVLSNIHNSDAEDEWMRIMAKRGYKAMFITDEELKSRYLKLLNETWSS
jgi:hypothetical protein